MDITNKIKIIQRNRIEDQRGWFLKVIDGHEEFLPGFTGEVYLTSAKPGEIKGSHYHLMANEWFTLISGACCIKLLDLATQTKINLILDAKDPKTIFVPAGVVHAFENIAEEDNILLAYTDKLYDPSDTISFDYRSL